ncbi:bifunctional 23S rRNA (guanine(2069)-N(7))-methyltransferase RlmK/23S rRNA (guanine(2445)-N(2))-methyltransferase RlmL [Gilvimarinus sp. F26214L]|uniref:bifunctional 23S rRNA (guanine(2069)-N(7))-methyltransferase RlmK/23S rRNA (guanine(2445)-N(2))-methyltransferase RlmL n=1 Tax=Gilvimarinus sp. DZF01 TaxID=3461371 RepID=UPI004045D264
MDNAPVKQPLFITCPKGLESLLQEELTDLGGEQARQTVAGVEVQGDLGFAYRVCLWSRLANKVLLPLARFPANSAEELYAGVYAIDWAEHLSATAGLWIDFVGSNHALRNSQFSAQKVKDAIVDRLRQPDGTRPTITRERPDLIVNVRLGKQQATVNIDLSGASLHKRGYRVDSVVAPMKENLAAALLIRAGWPQLQREGAGFIDPMCGSGTLLIEAALMAADIAPGIWREGFAFERWRQHDAGLWAELKEQAEQRHQQGLARELPEIRGYDENTLAIRAAERNIEAAGLERIIRVMRKPLADFKRPTHAPLDQGLLLTNPPYGERLGEHRALIPLYRQLGDILKSDFPGWRAGVFTGNPELGKAMGLRSYKKYKLFNGKIPSELLLFDVKAEYFVRDGQVREGQGGDRSPRLDGELSEGARMLANRLTKNRKQLGKYFEQRDVNCYRVYDADLPEYASAIDLYGDYIHVQEYAPPKSVDPVKAAERLAETQVAVAHVFGADVGHISIKQRRRTKGKSQYERLQDDSLQRMVTVQEGKARFLVNLWAYLDSGLFLDHRLVRQKVAELALGKRLLNLFCYTASVTVQAAIGGAASSVSVDMSKTYLRWAKRNFELNKLSDKHELVQADCLSWLENCREGFDVIMLDPPSFSNSKRMDNVLDVQRDHVKLIRRCMELLKPGGTLVFSTNLRRFKLDHDSLAAFSIEDFTRASIDRDFQRNPSIHQCFLITATR